MPEEDCRSGKMSSRERRGEARRASRIEEVWEMEETKAAALCFTAERRPAPPNLTGRNA